MGGAVRQVQLKQLQDSLLQTWELLGEADQADGTDTLAVNTAIKRSSW